MFIESIRDIPAAANYLERIGAKPRGLLSATVTETVGKYWRELANIKFTSKGEVVAPIGYEPTEGEAAAIALDFGKARIPKSIPARTLDNIPDSLKEEPKNLFVFWDTKGETILMLHSRMDLGDGEKKYIPWTYFEDEKWRPAEPDLEDGLPLYGLNTLKGNTTAFVFEGAKTAAHIQRIVNPKTPEDKVLADGFPWKEQMKHAAVVGFVGGALSPHRTNWRVLKDSGINRVIIFCDQDEPGTSVVPKIAEFVNLPTFAVKMGDTFPVAWDMGDEWPEKLFETIQGKKYYIGPSYFDCISPATFMTRKYPYVDEKGKERVGVKILPHAASQWAYIESMDEFVHVEFPSKRWSLDMLDKYLIPFSHTKKTSDYLLQDYASRIERIVYRPDHKEKKFIADGEMSLNLFRPSNIQPQKGDIKPFIDFLAYLIPDEKEAKHLERWIATLVGKPEVRMIHGVLLISEQTGVGKTLLCEKVLAPLVGLHNCSFPSSETILEPYTTWSAQKRLAIVSEVYQGGSWKLAQRLKAFITDTKITYREMYRNPVSMDNFLHIIANSNATEPLKFDEKERRWFVPTLTEERKSDAEYEEFIQWLRSGGLSIIMDWAMNYKGHLTGSDKAPATTRKDEIIEASKSKAIVRSEEVAKVIRESKEPLAICDKDMRKWLEAITGEKVYESLLQIRKTMMKIGISDGGSNFFGAENRIFINGQSQNILMNKLAVDMLSEIDDIPTRRERIKSMIKAPSEFMFQKEGD